MVATSRLRGVCFPYPMRVANWNVARLTELSSARGARIAEWLRTIDADVWVLTETHRSVVPHGAAFSLATVGSDRQQVDGEQWAAVCSRWPVERLEVVDDPVRSVAVRVIHPQGPFLVYALVLPWVGSTWRGFRSGDAFLRALAMQSAEWRRLRREYPKEPLIVAGDFNQDLLHAGHYYGSRAGRAALREAIASAGLVPVTGGATDPVRRAASKHATIDHLCVSPEWRVEGVGRWPETDAPVKRVSDHFGLWMDVRR